MTLRDGRAEHVERADERSVDDSELQDDCPEPRAAPEVPPTRAKLVEHRRRAGALRRRRSHRRERSGRQHVAHCVRGDRPAGVRRPDEDAAESGTADVRAVLGQPQRGVRLLEETGRDGLRDDPVARGEEERRRCAVHRREHRQLPDLRLVGEEERRRGRLARSADEVRSDHHEVARQPVGPDTAEEEEDDDGDLADREHDAEIGGRTGQVEHGEGERHRRHRASGRGHRAAREEEEELAFAKRSGKPQARSRVSQ